MRQVSESKISLLFFSMLKRLRLWHDMICHFQNQTVPNINVPIEFSFCNRVFLSEHVSYEKK